MPPGAEFALEAVAVGEGEREPGERLGHATSGSIAQVLPTANWSRARRSVGTPGC